MSKMKLDLEVLQVESFDPLGGPEGGAGGTVWGHGDPIYVGDQVKRTDYATCPATCQATCQGSDCMAGCTDWESCYGCPMSGTCPTYEGVFGCPVKYEETLVRP